MLLFTPDMLKAEEKSPSRKRKKKDHKDTGVKKKESRSLSSDEEFISLEMTDEDISVTVSKKAKNKAKRKGAKGLLVDNDINTTGSDSPKSITKSPSKKAKEKPRKSSPSKIDKKVKSADVSPIKSPRRTARMSIGNTDVTVLKKEREKSGTPKKKSGVKIECIEDDYDDSNVKKRGRKKSQQRINEESKEKSNLEDQTVVNKNTQRKIGKSPLRKSTKHKKDSSFDIDLKSIEMKSDFEKSNSKRKMKTTVVDSSLDTDLKSSEMKSDSMKSNSKRKMKTSAVEDTGGKKRRKDGTEDVSNTHIGKVELEDSVKHGKVTPKVKEYVQAEIKLVQSTLSEQKDKGTKKADKSAKESEPSAQERLNKRITQRIKEKRKHST